MNKTTTDKINDIQTTIDHNETEIYESSVKIIREAWYLVKDIRGDACVDDIAEDWDSVSAAARIAERLRKAALVIEREAQIIEGYKTSQCHKYGTKVDQFSEII